MFPNTTQTLEQYHAAVDANSTSQRNNSAPGASATCTPGSHHEIAIGAGLGGSLGVALIAALAALAWQWKRADTLAKERRRPSTEERSKEQASNDMQPEMKVVPSGGGKQYPQRHEAPHFDSQLYEVPSQVEPRELEARRG